MAIRWSPLKVKEATDKVEEIIAPVLEPLEQARAVVKEAEKIPNLPEYIGQRLRSLESEIERVAGKKPYKGNIHRVIDAIRDSLPKKDLAKEQASFQKWLDLFDGDKEKALVGMSIGRPEPKEAPTIQVGYNPVGEAIEFFCPTPSDKQGLDDLQVETSDSLLSGLAQNLADKTGKAIAIEPASIRAEPKEVEAEADTPQLTTQDYIYCEDCQMFVDFWKYDHNIADAGHEGCNWRYVTEEELEDLSEECEEEGCLEENRL